ncbi:glycosyltransferase family 32 protein [Catenibacterium mitsuokai]|uniref:glycosyltransferase family 32 protein n=1 Tax=Catenibacterium mitsuokai TaxID=100886 RepID=UPI003F8B14CA
MIPKTIHYCWFGRGELSAKAKKCIQSWKKYCPDYEIIEWNEDNFDVHQNEYTKKVYAEKKYAFLSDYARLKIVYEQGGIYLDVDVELVKSLDNLLENDAYFGFETKEFINTGVGFGAKKGSIAVKTLLEEYNQLLDGTKDVIGCPKLNTEGVIKLGLERNGQLQKLVDCTVYPADYFNPYDDPTGRLNKTKNTYSIHWYAKSWLDKKTIIRSKLTKPLHRIFGTDFLKKKR